MSDSYIEDEEDIIPPPDEAFESTKSLTKLAESLHNQQINITIPEDVRSYIQLRIAVIGKPIIKIIMTKRPAQSGISKIGKTISTTCITINATAA